MNKQYDLAVYIGRFQPFHNGHLSVIQKAQEIAEQVLILVGSANASPSCKNPWTYAERKKMIESSLDVFDTINGNVTIDYLDDYIYEENQWLADVQDAVYTNRPVSSRNQCSVDTKCKVALVGHTKDESSYYLKHFPQWDLVDVEYHEVIDATHIRQLLFEGKFAFIKGAVPEEVYKYITVDFMNNRDNYIKLLKEYKFIKEYKEMWAGSPYPPTFNTVDAVVIQSGHILLIQRGEQPGKGLWALPGGFVNENETLKDACIRELREETRLKVPEPVLRGSIVKVETFDHPGRSQRGRTITRTFYFQLDDNQALPKVKGGDDASHSEWILLSDFYNMATEMYEDHYHQVRKLLDNT